MVRVRERVEWMRARAEVGGCVPVNAWSVRKRFRCGRRRKWAKWLGRRMRVGPNNSSVCVRQKALRWRG